MGQFINEVQKINQNNNHKFKISEERQNVKNELYKKFCREFKNSDNYDDAYTYLTNWNTKTQICYNEYDFGNHVTMEFIDTTYYKQLKKVYKMFKENEKIDKAQTEKHELSKLMIVFDAKNRMKTAETYERHAKNNIPYDIETTENHKINHYKILDTNGNPYDFKIYYFKNSNAMDVFSTSYELRKDGILDNIPTESSGIGTKIFIALVCIPVLIYLIGHALIIALALLFILFIILFC